MARARTAGGVAGRLAWGLVAVAVPLYGATLALTVRRTHGFIAGDDPVSDAVFGLVWLVFAATGAVIVGREPRNGVGWAFIASAVLQIVSGFATEYAVLAVILRPGELPFGDVAAWARYNVGVIGTAVVPFMLLWFPTGRPLSRRWRPVEWLTWGCVGGLVVAAVLTWPHRGPGMMADPPPSYPGDDLSLAALMGASAALVAAGAALIVRFVGSRGIERQQLKLLALAASLVMAVIVLDLVGVLHESSATVLDVLAALAFGAVPVAAGVAMLRYRLFDLDRLISRTVAYAVVVAVLGLLYAGGVLLLGSVTRWLAPGASNDLVVAASTLVAAAAAGPLRRRVLAAVDRRFNRGRYDADRVIAAFGRRLRDEVELSVLEGDLRAALASTVQPSRAGLWLPATRGRS